MGHFCHICKCVRPNEKFSGRGHRLHICRDCQRLPRLERDHAEQLDEIWHYLLQKHISEKNLRRLKSLALSPDPDVQRGAALVLDIALVKPFKRGRWRDLANRHPELLDRAVDVLGRDFFEEVLMDYGDTEGPLRKTLRDCGA